MASANKWEVAAQWVEPHVEYRLLSRLDYERKREYALERKGEDKLGGVSWQSVFLPHEWSKPELVLESLYYATGGKR